MALLISVLMSCVPILSAQSNPKPKPGSNPPNPATTKGPSDAVHDVISTSFTSQDACKLLTNKDKQDNKLDTLRNELTAIDANKPLASWSSTPLAEAAAKECTGCTTDTTGTAMKKQSDTAYIFHLVTWTSAYAGHLDDPTVPVSSDWHVYQLDGTDTLKSTGFASDGSPRIYDKKNVLIVGIDRLKGIKAPTAMTADIGDAYTSTVTQGTPQNQTDLEALANALLGIKPGGQTAEQVPDQPPPFQCRVLFIAASSEPGTAHLPFDAKVTVASSDPSSAPVSKDNLNSNNGNGAKNQTQTQPSPGVMTCTGSGNSLPCTTTRTFTSKDLEWWDVSIAIAIPGVREAKYSIVNSALSQSVTLHTDFYAMLDLYPFAAAAPNDDWAPHFNVGVPVTSQSLYRPYFGMAESVGGLLTSIFRPERQIGLPLGLTVFGGMTFMKTKIVEGDPTTASELTSDLHSTHIWKPVFGVEVPVSSLVSKIKAVGGKNSNGSGKSTSSNSDSTQ